MRVGCIISVDLPIISITVAVSTIASSASSGTRVSLLFCRFNISKEFKFSKAIIGKVLMLNENEQRQLSIHRVKWNIDIGIGMTHSFFCKFKNVIESPKPVKASSAICDMLFALRSKCRSLCKRRSDSLGIVCKLLSPNLRYWRFSKKQKFIIYVILCIIARHCL